MAAMPTFRDVNMFLVFDWLPGCDANIKRCQHVVWLLISGLAVMPTFKNVNKLFWLLIGRMAAMSTLRDVNTFLVFDWTNGCDANI